MNHHKRIPQDVDYKIKNAVVILLGAAAIALLMWLTSCQKEISSLRPTPVIESDHHLKPPGGFHEGTRKWTPELEMASRRGGNGKGKGGGKPPKDTTVSEPPTDTTGNDDPPTVTGGKVILLDFDGQYVTGTPWNVNGPINARYSGMTEPEIQATIARVQADYSAFDVTVTADSTLYWAADPKKRMRVVITESWEWYGQAGGVAYIGSFTWGDNTPCFVFSSLLGYNGKYIADAASHEAGHTLGLRHQGKCDGTQYNPDLAADGKGYLMGYPYDKISGWQTGVTPYCTAQDDRAIIGSTLSR